MSTLAVKVGFEDSPQRIPLVLEVPRGAAGANWIIVIDLKRAIEKAIRVPTEQQHIFARNSEATELADHRLAGTNCDFTLGINSPYRTLQEKLPHIGASARQALADQQDKVDPSSVCEIISEEVTQAAATLHSQVVILSTSGGELNHQVTCDGEVLLPYRLLSDDAGLEMRGQRSYSYRAASAEHAAEVSEAVERRASVIAHCKKLLIDLPVALANNEAALEAHCEAVDLELNDLGAMVLERHRIQKEIAKQQKLLPELEHHLFHSTTRRSSSCTLDRRVSFCASVRIASARN